MAQTTNAMSGRNCYIALSTGGTTFTDISGFANSVEPDGGERQTGSVHTADTDYPIITAGKRDAITVKVKAVYTEVTTDPYTVVKTAYEAASALWVRWAPKGNTSGNLGFTTASGIVKTAPYAGVSDVSNGEALMIEFDLETPYITPAAIA
jgi:hypothetical protein